MFSVAEEREFDWRDLGICSNSDFQISDFFEKYEESAEHARLIDELCLACPVMRQCALEAQQNKEIGTRGAIYWDAGSPSDSKNSHKTPEVWKRIERKLNG